MSDREKINVAETVNVSKLINATSQKVSFRREKTSVPLIPGNQRSLTANASPNVYYVSLTETSEVVLTDDADKK
jgi:hypothetical protein